MLGILALPTFAAFVYKTDTELLTSADANGDGLLDLVVLDRATGNVRVGYQNGAGELTWSSTIPTGVPNATSLASGRFLSTDRESIAVTAPDFNHVRVLNLTDATTAASPETFAPNGVAPTGLIGLRAPAGVEGTRDILWVDFNQHDPGVTLIEMFEFLAEGLFQYQDSVTEEAYLETGNALRFGNNVTTFAAVMARGSNDTFLVYAFTNGVASFLARSNLPPRTEYLFGRFNNETYPRFLFYIPGESNIIVQSLDNSSGSLLFGPPTVNTFASPVNRIYFVDEGSNGLAMVHFGDGVAGMRLPGGSGALQEAYRFGNGGDHVSGVLPLSNARFALLSRGSNGTVSAAAQVYTRSGANYSPAGSSTLPRVTSNSTRANVWLFDIEPFVNSNPVFVSSVNGGDWIDSVTGLPGSLTVVAETDRGTSAGLGNPMSQTLSAPPNTVRFGVPNQYHPGISLFSYSSVRAPEPVLVVISPPAGHYESGINVSFTTSNASDLVYYRVGGAGLYQQYSTPLALASNATVQFYGAASSGERSSVQMAGYTFTDNSPPPLVTTNGTGTNNVPPGGTINTSAVPVYAYGTVVYSRMSGSNGTIWMVNLDGTSDRYITGGARPRLSPDGRYLAFLREGDPYATIPYNNGNIWIRDLLVGNEWRLITRSNVIYGYDWGYQTNLFFDDACGLFVASLSGNITQLAAGTHCNDAAPVVNPIDGSLAFDNVSGVASTDSGLFVTDASFTTRIPVAGAPVPHWPSWAPDGRRLAFASYSYTYIPEGGMNLVIAEADGSAFHQITAFAHGSGFRHGAVWSPAGDALIGAGTVFGTNGIWVLPLSEDGTHCEGTPWMIPITPGADFGVDFVGSVFVPPGPPRVHIRRDPGMIAVYWRRTAWPYVLETSNQLGPSAVWTPIAQPYPVSLGNYEAHIPVPPPGVAQYFRLRLP